MATFKVYPKEGGEPFTIECERFTASKDGFTAYKGGGKDDNSFLSMANVAAVIPSSG